MPRNYEEAETRVDGVNYIMEVLIDNVPSMGTFKGSTLELSLHYFMSLYF